ncbi:MAG TPA: hypothetical protein VGX49_15715 [Jatrophihabitans sp.]|nr:hypothetical protein [Jatrophihabitans sp.]
MAQEPDPPSFVVLPEEYEDEFAAGSGEPDPAGRARSPRPAPVPGRLTRLARHRRTRWAAAVLACLAAGGVMVTAVTSEHAAVRTATPAGPVPVPTLMSSGKPWPTAPSACGAMRYLPIVTADPLRTPTGIRVQVGGQSVHTVDLDAGSSVPAPGLSLSSLQFVTQLVPGKDASYALVQPCESTDTSSVLKITRDSSGLVLASTHIDALLADGRGAVWAAEVADIATDEPIILDQVGGPGVVRLPAGLIPVAVYGHRLIGLTSAADERHSASSGTLVSYDLTSRRLGPRIGRASSLTAGAGLLLWIDEPCSATAACVLHRYDLATGMTSARAYGLPVETSIARGVLSPDRTELAFPLERIYEGPRIDTEGFGPPFDVAVLHLDTGVLDTVGGLKLPPTELPGLSFSARGNWLVIALNEGRYAELLLWRPGLPRALRPGVRIEDLMLQSPPVLALPS